WTSVNPSGTVMAVTQAAVISSVRGQSSSPRAQMPARQARAASSCRSIEASSPSSSSWSQAASTPCTSETDGVNGNLPPSSHCSFQSSRDRNDARGAAGFSRTRAQASPLTLISDIPGGPPRHFCGPATHTSSCHSSALNGMPPTEETQSTSVNAPCVLAIGPISATGLSVPLGVSEWTTATPSIYGWLSRKRSTSAASTASLYATSSSWTSAPKSRSQ